MSARRLVRQRSVRIGIRINAPTDRRMAEFLEPRTFLSAGDLDPTFGGDGVVDATGFTVPLNASATSAAFSPTGQLVVAGFGGDTTGVVARYNPNGTLDTTFDGDGKVILPDQFVAHDTGDVTVQSNGKIVVSSGQYIARLNVSGSLDAGFSLTGIRVLSPLNKDFNQVLVQPDGKILVAAGGANLEVIRLTPDGFPDDAFNNGSTTVDAVPGQSVNERLDDLALAPDGKVLAALTVDPGGPTQHGVVVRLKANGTIDTSFDDDGIVDLAPGPNSAAYAVQGLEGGKVAVAGVTTNNFFFEHLRADGRTDPAYGTGGTVLTPMPAGASLPTAAFEEMEYTPDGKVLAAGPSPFFSTNNDAVVVRRFDADGTVDAAYGTAGEARVSVGTNPRAADLAVAANGDTAVAVRGPFNAAAQFSAAELTPQGQPNAAFNGGKVTTTFAKSLGDANLTTVAEAAGGKILAAGMLGTYALIARYNTDGSLDTTFGNGGWTVLGGPGRFFAQISEMVVLPDGKIVIGGSTDAQFGARDLLLIKLNADGSLDTTYGNNGIVTTRVAANSRGYINDLVVDSAGRVVAGGTLFPATGSAQFLAVRYALNGAPDTTFSGDGIVTTNVGTSDDQANAVAILAGDSVLLGGVAYDALGTTNSAWAFVKYRPDGTLDPAFGNQPGDPGLDIVKPRPDTNQVVQDVVPRADGGFFATGNVGDDVALGAFNPNGSPEPTFDGDGFATAGLPAEGLAAMPLRLARQPDGKFLVVADLSQPNGGYDIALLRFTAAGQRDVSFSGDGLVRTNQSPEDHPTDMALLSDGRVVLSGSMGQPGRPVLIRYQADGAAGAAGVYVRGSAWQSAFKSYMEAQGFGDDEFGFRVDGPGATAVAPILPWTNIDDIVVRFASAPTGGGIPTPANVTLDGIRSDYTVTAVAQVDPQTFVLRIDRPLGNQPGGGENGDHVLLTIPGAGPGGTALSVMLNILQGDVDRSGAVVAEDYSQVKNRFFRSVQTPGSGDTAYTIFHDVDGSSAILANDFSAVKNRFFDTFPPVPTGGAAAASTPSLTRELFGSKGVIA